MISREEAIQIAKSAMPQPIENWLVENSVLQNKVWYIGLRDKQLHKGFEVEIDAETGKIIGGGGG